jgi:hypothetical protein
MHALTASQLRSATLFKMLEITEENDEDITDTPPAQDNDVNTFSSGSKKFSRVIFSNSKDHWIIAPNDFNCKIHPWLVESEVQRLLVDTVAEDGVHRHLVAKMLDPTFYNLEISFVQGISITPSLSAAMDPFQVYATR